MTKSDKQEGQNELLKYRIQSLVRRIAKDCDDGKLEEAREKYEQAKQAIKERRGTYPSLESLVTPNVLVKAYINAGKVKEAFKLFADESREIAEGTEDKWLQEAGLALSDVDDVGKLIEAGQEFFVEQEKNEEARIQVRRLLLETIVVGCYASIVFDVFRRLKERKSTLRYKDDYMALKISAAVKNASAATIFNPEEAFQRFQNAFKELAELYEDKELQKAVFAYREVNDVWKRHTEATLLPERYQNRQSQQKFLDLISGCCGESILYYSETGNIGDAQAAYENLKQLVTKHGEKERELIVNQARGAGNLVYAYVMAQKPEEALGAYEELRVLTEKRQGNPKLRFLRANRASDVIYAYATAQKPDDARPIYEELRQLAEDYPEESRLKMWQAEGALDLTYGYIKAGKRESAVEVSQQLEELRKKK